jgi:GTPase SAR1 family protein
MGSCGSKPSPGGLTAAQLEKKKVLAEKLDEQQRDKHKKDRDVKKLLLLGAGESGKSTLFKQMISLYGKGFSEADRKAFKTLVHNNVIVGIQALCKAAEDKKGMFEGVSPVDPALEPSMKFVLAADPEGELSGELASHIKALWRDPGIKALVSFRNKFQMHDSAPYFLDKVDDFMKADYVASENDMLKARVRTAGIVQTKFEIDKSTFHMFDVGGQRNERKKWIHCFENVTAVIFVAAISEYDQVLFEDDSVNRVQESLTLFDEVCNSKWFTDTSIILFLNKRDLLQEKITKSPISSYFPAFSGGSDYDAAVEFFRLLFERKKRNPDKEIYTHVTCATDKGNIKHVFDSVKDTIIRKSLRDGGLI